MNNAPKVPMPFPADFDPDDGPCLLCGGDLDTGWECNDCGADHLDGVILLCGLRAEQSPKVPQ